MAAENQFDVIIIGTGAGGGTLAYGWLRWASESCCSSGATMSRAKKPTGILAPSTSKGNIKRRRSGETNPANHSILTPTIT